MCFYQTKVGGLPNLGGGGQVFFLDSKSRPRRICDVAFFHRLLLLKLDKKTRSHLGGLCTAPQPLQHGTPPPPSALPCPLHDQAGIWCHRFVCIVLTIDVYDVLQPKLAQISHKQNRSNFLYWCCEGSIENKMVWFFPQYLECSQFDILALKLSSLTW